MFTLEGAAILSIDGQEHRVEAGTAFLIPPDVPHPARVVSDGNRVAVAAYCDECPVLKVMRGKEDVRYPLAVEGWDG